MVLWKLHSSSQHPHSMHSRVMKTFTSPHMLSWNMCCDSCFPYSVCLCVIIFSPCGKLKIRRSPICFSKYCKGIVHHSSMNVGQNIATCPAVIPQLWPRWSETTSRWHAKTSLQLVAVKATHDNAQDDGCARLQKETRHLSTRESHSKLQYYCEIIIKKETGRFLV